jgi:hypothetical protein
VGGQGLAHAALAWFCWACMATDGRGDCDWTSGCSAFYADPDLRVQEDCGELTRASLERARGLVKAAIDAVLEDPLQLARCMGAHVTAPRRPRLGGEAYPQPLWESDGGAEGTWGSCGGARNAEAWLADGEVCSLL